MHAPDAGGESALPRQTARVTPATSKALNLCRLAEGMPGADQSVDHCMEWHSATAHAVAGAAGKRIRACNGGAELTYNKPDWSSECLTVSR
jgi:3'-phosphoadenosine 5'-phosphosulfate (PAPS) 3'-phosphatase